MYLSFKIILLEENLRGVGIQFILWFPCRITWSGFDWNYEANYKYFRDHYHTTFGISPHNLLSFIKPSSPLTFFSSYIVFKSRSENPSSSEAEGGRKADIIGLLSMWCVPGKTLLLNVEIRLFPLQKQILWSSRDSLWFGERQKKLSEKARAGKWPYQKDCITWNAGHGRVTLRILLKMMMLWAAMSGSVSYVCI